MKICLICVEIFAWGKYGGFGRSTRMLGRELVRRGVEVTAVVPRRKGQQPVEILDGMRVLSFQSDRPLSSLSLYRAANADIYHSQEPSFGTFLAQLAMPSRKHVVTFRDPRDLKDWYLEFRYPSLNHAQVLTNLIYEDNFLVRRAVRRAQAHYVAAHFLALKSRRKYKLSKDPEFLPSPIVIPEQVKKSATPVVCFVGRFDRRKRPELFFELAAHYPDVQFVAAGTGRDTLRDQSLRDQYKHLPNLEIVGFVDQFSNAQLSEILQRSWILINTSVREGLPTTFVEAAAHGCAILSSVDPDGFASQFGFHVSAGDYGKGLDYLLTGNRWAGLGQKARLYVSERFDLHTSIQQHLDIYQGLTYQ